MDTPFRTEPKIRPASLPDPDDWDLSASDYQHLQDFPPAQQMLEQLEEIPNHNDRERASTSSRHPTASTLEKLTWILHPDERVPLKAARRHMSLGGGPTFNRAQYALFKERALKQAKQEGIVWSPLVDVYSTRLQYRSNNQDKQPPRLESRTARIDQLADWMARQGSFERVKPLLEFGELRIHAQAAKILSGFSSPAALEWIQEMLSNGSSSEQVKKNLAQNQTLSSEALLELCKDPATVRIHRYKLVQHPQARFSHWEALVDNVQSFSRGGTLIQFRFLPDAAWKVPSIREKIRERALALPLGREKWDARDLLEKLLETAPSGRADTSELLAQMAQEPYIDVLIEWLEAGKVEADELSSSTWAQLMVATQGDPELHKRLMHILGDRSLESAPKPSR